MTLRALCMIVFGLLVGGCAAQQPTVNWQLTDADRISQSGYVILTVPMEDPAELSALADVLAEEFGVSLAAEWPLASINVHCLVYDARNTADIDALLAAMEADDRIRTAQRIYDFTTYGVVHSDPLYELQWALERMNIPVAHSVSLGEGMRIGVVDSAIDRTHPDLSGRVADARDFVAEMPADAAEAHGTAVAGVIGAAAANIGMVGVAPAAELVGLRACWQAQGRAGACNSFSLARAINFAILNDIDVLNMSVGGPEDPLLTELIQSATAKGIVVVAASGEGSRLVFPASLDAVIAAGRATPRSVPAPATDVLTTAPGAEHRYASGSSIATAHVSGVVALMLARDPSLQPATIAERLAGAVRGSGRARMLDACKALSLAPTDCAI